MFMPDRPSSEMPEPPENPAKSALSPAENPDAPAGLSAMPGDAADLRPDDPIDFGLGFGQAAAKVREFPAGPGVYLMKDSLGRVIYVGKAKSLRSRAGSYFLKAAAEDRRTAELVREICDIDFIECESEVDALLAEARLVKDIQ